MRFPLSIKLIHTPFVSFRLLHPAQEGYAFIVETFWESKADFENWTRPDEFRQGHAQAEQLPKEAFSGHPQLELYDVAQAANRGEILADTPASIPTAG